MKNLLDKIFPTLSDDLSAITSLISSLPFSLSLLSENFILYWDSERLIAEHCFGAYCLSPFNIIWLTLPGMEHSSSSFR